MDNHPEGHEDETTDGHGGNGAPPSESGERAADPAAPAAAATPEAESPKESPDERVARLEREKTESHERMLRVAADFENFKKRMRRAEEDAAVRAREGLLRELLPVLDNLERATAAVGKGGSVDALAQGVRLVEKQFHGALEKFHVKGFDALGEAFDPNRHEAIQQVETEAHPPGSVATVFSRGYTIGERLLRPAIVAVAKAPSKPESATDGDGAARSAEEGNGADTTDAKTGDE